MALIKETGISKRDGFLRKVLYMVTFSAIKHNSLIKKFYKELIEKGKKPKVAIVAAMRKMIAILNAKMANFLIQEMSTLLRKSKEITLNFLAFASDIALVIRFRQRYC